MKKVNYLYILGAALLFIQSTQAEYIICPESSKIKISEVASRQQYKAEATVKIAVCNGAEMQNGAEIKFVGSRKEGYQPGKSLKLHHEGASLAYAESGGRIVCEYQIEGLGQAELFSLETYTPGFICKEYSDQEKIFSGPTFECKKKGE